MKNTDVTARFVAPENSSPEEAHKLMLKFVKALARADARRDLSETRNLTFRSDSTISRV